MAQFRQIPLEAEEAIQKEFTKRARERCPQQQQAFVQCTNVGKLHAVLRCREQLHALNSCLSQYTTQEEYDRVVDEYLADPHKFVPAKKKRIPRKDL